MTGTKSPTQSPPRSPSNGIALASLKPPNRTVNDAYKHTSWVIKEPEISFGTGTRPPLNPPTNGPGPGAYQIKSTTGKLFESHIKSPCQFSIRGRTKFGDPNAKALSKNTANEPG